MKNILEVKNLSYQYSENDLILSNVSFQLQSNTLLGIIGPNGGGKTTLLRIIAGLIPIQEGEIVWNGKEISKNFHKELRLSYVPQRDTVNTSLPITVKDMIIFGNLPDKVNKRELSKLLEKLGLTKLKDSLIKELSGGQLQRVLLAKALIRRPSVLLLDEPTKGLDSTGQDQLLNLMNTIQEETECSIILVDHNINQVIKHCDEILCLNRKHHWHDKKELFNTDIMNSVYHCEFEHSLIHENQKDGKVTEHHQCSVHPEGHEHD
ncbi:MAG: metal ABC transporter ATP-binding protein [Bacteriovoracaceae bacterium]|nr:metal ABC transporter ATP-binding protein [Bacteriovoracaceae bacterium]